jgi:hypothetical protein
MVEKPLSKPKHKVWKKQIAAPLPKWHRHQGSSNDCGPYSAMFVVNSLRDAPVVDADILARRMEGPRAMRGSWLPSRIKGWATFPWGVAGALRTEGVRVRWRMLARRRALLENLDLERPTIVIVGEPLRFRRGKYAGWSHYKVLYAWDPEEGFAFVDPAADEGVTYTYQDEASFVRQWTAMGRQLIEVL